MYMQINKELTKPVTLKVMPIIGYTMHLLGFTSNSKLHTVTLLTICNNEIILKAENWSEYLQIIRYTRKILRNQRR